MVLSKPNGEDRVGLECYVEKDEDEDDDEGGGGNDADEEMLDGELVLLIDIKFTIKQLLIRWFLVFNEF